MSEAAQISKTTCKNPNRRRQQDSADELNMAEPEPPSTKSKANKIDGSEPPEWAEQLFSQLQALSNKVDEKLDSVVQSIKTLNKDTQAIHHRIINAEERISTPEDMRGTTSNQVKLR